MTRSMSPVYPLKRLTGFTLAEASNPRDVLGNCSTKTGANEVPTAARKGDERARVGDASN